MSDIQVIRNSISFQRTAGSMEEKAVTCNVSLALAFLRWRVEKEPEKRLDLRWMQVLRRHSNPLQLLHGNAPGSIRSLPTMSYFKYLRYSNPRNDD